jgi:sugar lactone lactonase YvrE
MSEDFVTRLQLQLREAALREERRSPVARHVTRARSGLPGPAPLAAALAVAALALAVALGALALRGEPQPSRPRVVDDFRVAPGLSSLAAASGAVWAVSLDGGQVLRVDPSTRRVVARVHTGGPDAQVAAGRGAVWALAGDLLLSGDAGAVRLLRIDPATGRVVARIPMRAPGGGSFAPLVVHAGQGVVWVTGPGGALRVDPRRNAVDRFVPLGAGAARGAVAAGERVWTLGVDGRLREREARSGRTLGTVRVRGPLDTRLAGAAPSTLTLAGHGRIERIDAGSGRRLWTADLGGDVRDWLPDGAVLWAHVSHDSAGRDELVRLDADSGRELGRLALPEPGVAGMAKVERDLWVATPGGRVVVVR